MSIISDQILGHFTRVAEERQRRLLSKGLSEKVEALKAYQQRRFALTYADLLASERFGPAARFFLDELYGPRDFSSRDAQFVRVVPSLVRLFPQSILAAVCLLAELHELSERLDTAMGLALESPAVDARAYAQAWARSASPADRERQIELTIELGEALDRLTRKPLVLTGLRMMRGPATAAGLADLQHVLETGFAAFLVMHGAQDFLAIVQQRERALAALLFSARVQASDAWAAGPEVLPQLP
jgi:hypothetical protein